MMSRTTETFYEMYVRARVTAKTGIRDLFFALVLVPLINNLGRRRVFIAQMI